MWSEISAGSLTAAFNAQTVARSVRSDRIGVILLYVRDAFFFAPVARDFGEGSGAERAPVELVPARKPRVALSILVDAVAPFLWVAPGPRRRHACRPLGPLVSNTV